MIVSNPDIMLGKPTIEGTRITVESILGKLAAGRTYEEVLEAYPRLSQGDIYDRPRFCYKVAERYNNPPNAAP